MTQVAHVLPEKLGSVGPVEIYILRVGEDNLDQTERVRRARLLPHQQPARFQSFQNFGAHRTIGDDLTFGRDDFKVVLAMYPGSFRTFGTVSLRWMLGVTSQ